MPSLRYHVFWAAMLFTSQCCRRYGSLRGEVRLSYIKQCRCFWALNNNGERMAIFVRGLSYEITLTVTLTLTMTFADGICQWHLPMALTIILIFGVGVDVDVDNDIDNDLDTWHWR